MCLDIRIFSAQLRKDLVPEDHGIIEGVRLADTCQGLSFFPGQFIGIADNPLAPLSGKDSVLNDHFFGLVLIQPGAAPGIFSFGIFPDKGHVDVFSFYIFQGAGCSREQLYRTQIDILIETVTDFQQQAPQGNMVRNTGIAHGSQQNGVIVLQDFHSVFRHHPAGL